MIDLNAVPVAIPDLAKVNGVLHVMPPLAKIPQLYKDVYQSHWGPAFKHNQTETTTSEPQVLMQVLQCWFFKGLTSIEFKLNYDKVTCTRDQFRNFVRFVLEDRGPQHEHKIMFLTWLLHVCCTSVTFKVKDY